jgi:hypothetical protein
MLDLPTDGEREGFPPVHERENARRAAYGREFVKHYAPLNTAAQPEIAFRFFDNLYT